MELEWNYNMCVTTMKTEGDATRRQLFPVKSDGLSRSLIDAFTFYFSPRVDD